MNIYFIRHGRQNSKLCNVNVELASEGIRQAELVGERLKAYGIEAVYSSDLIRAVETADIMNRYIGVPRFIDSRLRESNFGELTGLETEEMKRKYKDFLKKRAEMTVDAPYPGGGENCEMVFQRVFEAVNEIAHKNYDNVAVVTHGGAIRALFTGILGADYAKWLTYGRQIENCSISEIMYDEKQESFHIERFNDYAHIEKYDDLLRKHFSSGFFVKKTMDENEVEE